MKNRLISLMLAALLVVSLFPLSASAADIVDSGACGDNLTWTLDSEGLLTISGTGSMTDYEWNESPFFQNTSILSVIIEPGVTSIGNRALISCSSLTNVTIPESVTSIGVWAFSSCSSLTNVTIPESVTSIGGWAFSNCSSLTSITILGGVTSIGSNAFENCSSLTSAEIPESVTGIGNYAFENCSSLTSVVIPESVTGISRRTFYGCTSLTSVTIKNGVTSIGEEAFSGCGSLTSVEIPESVTSIGSSAFSGCSSLTSVTIMDGVESIESAAFRGCSSLTSVEIPESVTSIGNSAFSGCSNLATITIPGTETSVGAYALQDCTSLTEVFFGGDAATWKSTIDASNILLLEAPHIHFNTASPEGHFRPITVPATCEADGYTARTCDCGYEYDRVVTEPALGHDWTPWATLLEPTATTKGIAVRICANDPKHVEFKALPTVAECPSKNFTDVDFNAYYHIPMDWAVENGITTGVTATTFEPNRSCSRAQFVTFLWRAKGCPEPTVANPFVDVPNNKYYTKAVLWAVENGVTTGNSGGTFNPDGECTRAQVVTFLWRAAGEPEPASTTNPFQDVSASAYYYKAVLWALENGITTGNTATTFNPSGKCTRAHVVTFLYRAYA